MEAVIRCAAGFRRHGLLLDLLCARYQRVLWLITLQSLSEPHRHNSAGPIEEVLHDVTKAAQIAELNDAFRRGDPSVPGQRIPADLQTTICEEPTNTFVTKV